MRHVPIPQRAHLLCSRRSVEDPETKLTSSSEQPHSYASSTASVYYHNTWFCYFLWRPVPTHPSQSFEGCPPFLLALPQGLQEPGNGVVCEQNHLRLAYP